MPSNEERYFADKCKPYQAIIAELAGKEKEILEVCRKDPDNAAKRLFELSHTMLNLASYYIVINGLSLTILKAPNEDARNNARKIIYKAVIFLENIVTNKVDVPFSEYEKQTKELAVIINSGQRLGLVKKMGFAIDLLKTAYGENSKWKESFIELEARFAAVAKNMLDFSTLIADIDPRSDNYEATKQHIALVKQLLADVSAKYRDRYSVSTHNITDIHLARNLLGSLRYLHILLNEQTEASKVKKQYDFFHSMIQNETKKAKE